MEQFQESAINKNPFSEARKMIANELYVPSRWGKVVVDNSGQEPKIVYERNSSESENKNQEVKQQ